MDTVGQYLGFQPTGLLQLPRGSCYLFTRKIRTESEQQHLSRVFERKESPHTKGWTLFQFGRDTYVQSLSSQNA